MSVHKVQRLLRRCPQSYCRSEQQDSTVAIYVPNHLVFKQADRCIYKFSACIPCFWWPAQLLKGVETLLCHSWRTKLQGERVLSRSIYYTRAEAEIVSFSYSWIQQVYEMRNVRGEGHRTWSPNPYFLIPTLFFVFCVLLLQCLSVYKD